MVRTAEEMLALGSNLARALPKKAGVVYLEGDLGVGKTTLVRGVLGGMGYNGKVKSPSFTLMEIYPTAIPLCHLDLYRLNSLEELEELGVNHFLSEAYGFIEWPENGYRVLPVSDLILKIYNRSNGYREVIFEAISLWGKEVLEGLNKGGIE